MLIPDRRSRVWTSQPKLQIPSPKSQAKSKSSNLETGETTPRLLIFSGLLAEGASRSGDFQIAGPSIRRLETAAPCSDISCAHRKQSKLCGPSPCPLPQGEE